MAIIAISRQVAALGDEIAAAVAKKLGYTFITRKQIEDRIVELGFPKEKLQKNEIKYIKNCTNRVILYTLH